MFPLKKGEDIIPIYMGDRWSYPHQASAATYVWMPMLAEGTSLSIPEYWQAWDVDYVAPVRQTGKVLRHDWSSEKPGDILCVPFHGKRVFIPL